MKKSSFYFDLPESLIAKRPLDKRSSSRLLVLQGDAHIEHERFYDLAKVLRKGDLLVFNNTRVVPARLFGRKETGGAVEILVERLFSADPYSGSNSESSGNRVRAQVRASKSPKAGTTIVLENGSKVQVIGRENDMFVLESDTGWIELMESIGHMPLPPYIDREDDDADKQRYQTVYASNPGAVAAPTAGLHFDECLLETLADMGVERAEVCLHVGAGTYQPVRVDDISDHKMHAEWFSIDEEVIAKIKAAKSRGGRVVAVGTTAVRSLESAFDRASQTLKPFQGDTDIFLYPGKKFNVVDALITNFHLPESTLLMLVSAFAGYSEIMAAYREAVQQQYRFFSYGDSMFLTCNNDAFKDIPA